MNLYHHNNVMLFILSKMNHIPQQALSRTKCNFCDILDELMIKILRYVDIDSFLELQQIRMVCRRFLRLTLDWTITHDLFMKYENKRLYRCSVCHVFFKQTSGTYCYVCKYRRCIDHSDKRDLEICQNENGLYLQCKACKLLDWRISW